MKKLVSSLKKFIFAAFLPFLVTACGNSPGGTVDTSDDTPPVTTANPPGGTYSSPQSISLDCADSSSGCWKTSYNPGDGEWRDYDVDTPLEATAASGAITLEFFSIDKSGNVENVQTEEYTIE